MSTSTVLKDPETTQSDAAATTGTSIAVGVEEYATLLSLAKKQNINIADAINQAIGIAKIVVDVNQADGERILVQKGKQLQELTLV